MTERGQVGPPLARQHRHGVAWLQRPGDEQRLKRGARALHERDALRPDAEQPGQPGPARVQDRLHLGFGHVRADRGLALGVRRGRAQRSGRAAPCGRRVQVQHLGRGALPVPPPPRLGQAVRGVRRPHRRVGHGDNCPMGPADPPVTRPWPGQARTARGGLTRVRARGRSGATAAVRRPTARPAPHRAAGPVAERACGQPGHPLDGEQAGQLAGQRLEQDGPGPGQAAPDDHESGVQDALAPGQRAGERADRFVPGPPGGRITGRHQADHAGGAGDPAAGQLAVPAGHRRGRGHRLQAAGAAAAAPAAGACGHGHVADLAAERVRACVGPAVQHQRRGDPGARLDQEEVTRPGGRSEAGLGPGRGPHIVAEGHGQAEPPSQPVGQRHIVPADVGGEPRHARRLVHHPGDGQAKRGRLADPGGAGGAHQLRADVLQPGQHRGPAVARAGRDARALDHPPVRGDHHGLDHRAADVGGDHGPPGPRRPLAPDLLSRARTAAPRLRRTGR